MLNSNLNSGREIGADALKVIAIVMVVFIHSGNELPASFVGSGWSIQFGALFFKHFISNGLARVAVPIFFFISGYLAARGWVVRGFDFKTDIAKRTRTILIPYLIWSLVVFAGFALVQMPEATHRFFNKQLINDMSMMEVLTRLFITPIPYQLWFLRDLYIFFLCSPILFGAIRKVPLVFFMLAIPAWLTNTNIYLSIDGLLFFSTGLLFGSGKLTLNLGASVKMAIILWGITSVAAVYLRLIGFPEYMFLSKLAIVLGVTAMLTAADAGVFNNLGAYSIYTLPVFLFHEPLLTFVKKLSAVFFSDTPQFELVIFLVAPVFVIVTSIALSIVLANFLPGCYGLLVGGRRPFLSSYNKLIIK